MDMATDFGFDAREYTSADGNAHLFRTGQGVLHTVTLNQNGVCCGVALLRIYDGVDNTGTLIAIFDMVNLLNPVTMRFDLRFTIGLYVENDVNLAGLYSLTLTYR